MRPSDENQAGSHPKLHSHLRPNLMSSSRRSGREDSILAKLERAPAGRAGQGNGLRLAWYGGAVLVAIGLTATLAWLAAGSGQQAQGAQDDGKPAAVAAAPALVVDTPPEAAPPLRMLEAPPAPAAPAEVVVSLDAPPVPAAGLEPGQEAKPEPKPEPKPRLAVATKPRPAPRTAARQSSRSPRTAAPTRQNEQDDSDVALISAVIYHANGHAAGAADDEQASSCADDACRTRASRQ